MDIISGGQTAGGRAVGRPLPHLHQLLKTSAESRVAATARAQGWEAGPGLLGKLMGEVRRAMIVTVAVL